MIIQKEKFVALRYAIKGKRGNTITDIMNDKPFKYVVGSGRILPALEKNIEGLKAGDHKSFILLKADNQDMFEDLYIDVAIDEVRDPLPEELPSFRPIQVSDGCSGEEGCC
jgi:FKBP-type peptidyl-prolyl cis-trans isomerase (trigger factor)